MNVKSANTRNLEGSPISQLFQIVTFHETRLKRIENFLSTITDDNGDFCGVDTGNITILENGMSSLLESITDIRKKQVVLEKKINKKSQASSAASIAIISEQLRLLFVEVTKLKEKVNTSLVIEEEEDDEEEES